MSKVSAASGPYAAELSASNPKMECPGAARFARHVLQCRQGLPTRRSRMFIRQADTWYFSRVHLQREEQQSQPPARGR